MLNKVNFKEDQKKISLIIDHCRVYEVEKIEKKEIKRGWKFSKNWLYEILDKDYGKSAELMRYVVEERKKMSMVWIIILCIVWILFIILTIYIIYSIVATPTPTITTPTPTKTIQTENNPVIENNNNNQKTISTTPWETKKNNEPVVITQEEKQNNEPVVITQEEKQVITTTPWNNGTDPQLAISNYNELNAHYATLQDTYNQLEKNFEIMKYKLEVCEKNGWIVEQKSPVVEKIVEVEKKLTQKEKMALQLWKNIIARCDNALNNNNNESWICKDLYSNYIINN